MKELLNAITEHIHEHWIKFVTAAAFMALGWLLGKRRARNEWKRKEFLSRINVSLNTLQDGRLLIRTLLEKPCEEIFLNSVATEAVIAAARNTTVADPTLPLPQNDYWHYLNSVLNEISEKFALGQMRRDMGLPVTREQYLVALTCENAGEMRTRKVRAMVIRKKVLENLPPEQPQFDSPTHLVRWETLKKLAELWKTQPWKFLDVEIAM